jgi:putative aldouronate transport system permease protein
MIRATVTRKGRTAAALIHLLLSTFMILCILPILLVISISLSDDATIKMQGYSLFPQKFSARAYEFVFSDPTQIVTSYAVTIFVTALGLVFGLWLTATLAYATTRKDYKLSGPTSFYVFLTMLFNGGLVPTYILVANVLHMKNTIFAILVPYLVIPWYVLLLKGFMRNIPASFIESAKIDGAGEFRIFTQIILPLSKPGLATVGLFIVLTYWNDWWLSLLYIDNSKFITLQYLLYRILSSIQYLTSSMASDVVKENIRDIPTLSARMSMCVLAAGPILFVFPFFQKYFVRGLTVGGIKG